MPNNSNIAFKIILDLRIFAVLNMILFPDGVPYFQAGGVTKVQNGKQVFFL
jgi:hypothetical protein